MKFNLPSRDVYYHLGIHDFKTSERYHRIKITMKILPAAYFSQEQYFITFMSIEFLLFLTMS